MITVVTCCFSGQRAGLSPPPADAAVLQHVLFSLLVVLSCVHVGSKGWLGGWKVMPNTQ